MNVTDTAFNLMQQGRDFRPETSCFWLLALLTVNLKISVVSFQLRLVRKLTAASMCRKAQ